MSRHSLKLFLAGLITLSSTAGTFADGMLSVKTDPEGIEIWLDDQFVGDSPVMDKKLKPGRYSLKLVDPIQHSSTIEEIFIQDGETTVIEKTIKSKFGTLKINSTPEGAQVYISSDLGNTPVSNDFMNPGKYRIELRHPNKLYKSVMEDVTIPRGESVTISKTLEKRKVLDGKAKLRLLLGAGTAGGFVWAIIKQGDYKSWDTKLEELNNNNYKVTKYSAEGQKKSDKWEKEKSKAGAMRTLGIIGGSLCLLGLEITAFF
ncbi:MAG TPA: PEGA domain-containing protein [Chitinispirillaceae bacterium]|nr:PEGA domain-containing protein [Chitinispirillaceae bacterium]